MSGDSDGGNPLRTVGFEVVSDDVIGDGATNYLVLHRAVLRNRRADGSSSEAYPCDYVVRPRGRDAVVVAVYCRRGGAVEVLIREGIRPALELDRPDDELAVPDGRSYFYLLETVAGIVEREDRGEAGILSRAAIEVHEEAGFKVETGAVRILGAGTFPSPGAFPEKYWLTAVEVDPDAQGDAIGDGSPMEEGTTTRWMPIDDAIAACVAGDIEDMKTELVLRRLREALAKGGSGT